MRKLLATLTSTLLLAGCGVQPTLAPMPQMRAHQAVSAKDWAFLGALTVPADVMANVNDYTRKLDKEHNIPGDGPAKPGTLVPPMKEAVSYNVELYASRDGFKTTLKTGAVLYYPPKTHADGSVTYYLPDGATGEYQYYLVVKATVCHPATEPYKQTPLPDFYVSNFGHNFQAAVTRS